MASLILKHSQGAKEEEITPWCPENCIITEWNSWSKCSETCVPVPVIFFGNLELNDISKFFPV